MIWILLSAAFVAYCSYEGLHQILVQIDAWDRVRLWDWVAFSFFLGWLVEVHYWTGVFLDFVRRDWQSLEPRR